MRRALLGIVSIAAFCGILVAAFWGSGPEAKKPAPAPSPAAGEPPKKVEEPPRAPPRLLGVQPAPGADDEWRGARVGVLDRKVLEMALAEYASSRDAATVTGQARMVAMTRRELELIWGTEKAVESLGFSVPWIVAVEETRETPGSATAVEIVAALRDFHLFFRARFRSLFESRPPAADWTAPLVVLASRDEYLRRAKPPAFSTSHTNLQSGWAFLSRGNRDLVDSACHEATWQTWIALARVRAPGEGIPTASLSAWFWDGTAAYFSAARHADPRPMHFGEGASRPMADVRTALREKKLKPLSSLLAATFGELDVSPDPLAAFAVLSQSWAFVAFVETAEKGKRRESLDRYAELELSGKGGIEAAKECFGDLEALDREYRAFVKLF
ncbi:MAG: hypothetical protein FD180_2517 [Planctomycetota bacterium]|nr:MAG: hypothetical protein FD180_2517 [Planctomycetota bacterium]